MISKAMTEVIASAALTGFVTATDNAPDVCGHQIFNILFHIPFFPSQKYLRVIYLIPVSTNSHLIHHRIPSPPPKKKTPSLPLSPDPQARKYPIYLLHHPPLPRSSSPASSLLIRVTLTGHCIDPTRPQNPNSLLLTE